jgi:hypothetical protein
MGLCRYDRCGLDLLSSYWFQKIEIKINFISSEVSSLNPWWVLDGLVRCVWELNLLSSPHCEVYPHEIEGKPSEGGEMVIYLIGEHSKTN